MKQTSRAEIFSQASQTLRREFQELDVVPHSALKGGDAERLVRRFLETRLPRRFGVGSGFIIDPKDKVSRQTDVIIYDALNCPIYRASPEAAIYPADNVGAVIEVKSRIDGRELRDGFAKISEIKSFSKHQQTGPFHAQTFATVFAFESALSKDRLLQQYTELVWEFGLGAHPDVVAVLDFGCVFLLSSHPAHPDWVPVYAFEGTGGASGEGAHFAAGWHPSGTATLDLFFRILLVSLNTFRAFADFDWRSASPISTVELAYIGSHTNETDPEKREQLLRRYRLDARSKMSVLPPNEEVIPLGPGGPDDK